MYVCVCCVYPLIDPLRAGVQAAVSHKMWALPTEPLSSLAAKQSSQLTNSHFLSVSIPHTCLKAHLHLFPALAIVFMVFIGVLRVPA